MGKTTPHKLYAFWRYDQFPFMLGGTVSRIRENGDVETKEYGVNHWFHPIKLLPVSSGLILHKKMKELEEQYRIAAKEFHSDWRTKIAETVPFFQEIKNETH